jgi:hypothetical protein
MAGGYANPIGSGLVGERIDMGVDYGGRGNLYALGNGTVVNINNAGWPGGRFLCIRLDNGLYVFYAEDITPYVSVGQKVTAGQRIAFAYGGGSGIEVGWAAAPGTGLTMAVVSGQAAKGLAQGDPGKYTTAFGLSMSNLIKSLGGPPGIVHGPVQGKVPAHYPTSGTASSAPSSTTSPATSGVSSSEQAITMIAGFGVAGLLMVGLAFVFGLFVFKVVLT